jgi:hypothetical protein
MTLATLDTHDTIARRAFRAVGEVFAPSMSVPLLLVAIPAMLAAILVVHKIVGE